jgi:hypothetical protein
MLVFVVNSGKRERGRNHVATVPDLAITLFERITAVAHVADVATRFCF